MSDDCNACFFGHDPDCERGKEIDQMEQRIAALESAAQDVAKFNWGTSVTEEYHFQRIDAMAKLRSVLRGLSDQTS